MGSGKIGVNWCMYSEYPMFPEWCVYYGILVCHITVWIIRLLGCNYMECTVIYIRCHSKETIVGVPNYSNFPIISGT